MFKLKFHLDSSYSEVEAVEIDDGSMNQNDISSLRTALDKLQVENPCLVFARKMKTGDFENMPEHVIANIAYMSENLGDCWVYPDAPPMENGKPDARAYMGVMNLLQNVLNLALQSRKRLDEYREVYGELPSDIFGDS